MSNMSSDSCRRLRRAGTLYSLVIAIAVAGTPSLASERITVAYQSAGGIAWPLYIASQGGYYRKYGLDVDLVMAGFPGGLSMLINDRSVMTIAGLQQLIPAAAKDDSLLAISAWMNRSTFSMVARKGIKNIRELKGRRIGISQIGDAVHGYTLALFRASGMDANDVILVPVGPDMNRRAAALLSGRVDATLLTAPAVFRLEEDGYANIANLADYGTIFTSAASWVKKNTLRKDRKLLFSLVEAHAEAINRFYRDKPFAVEAYLAFDRQNRADVERAYDLFATKKIFEDIPFISRSAVVATFDQHEGQTPAKEKLLEDARHSIDNSVIDLLVKNGFFERVFGSNIRAKEQQTALSAFR